MTRTTLKALWFGGGGIIATWLAVSPAHVAPSSSESAPAQKPAVATELSAEHLSAQTNRLREHAGAVTLDDSKRNLFQYNSHHAAGQPRHTAPAETIAPMMPVIPQQPPFALSGVAQKAGKRTAVISNAGQIYVVGEGDTFAGSYTVVKVDPEAVVIRGSDGVEHRLILR
jgi:type II secretory pathway component PulC